MAQETTAPQKKGRSRRRKSGYIHRSPAVCIVVHDPSGKVMPNSVADEILEVVTDLALKHGYLINYTRT